MNACSKKRLRRSMAARTVPTRSMPIVPAKFCRMTPRVRRTSLDSLDEAGEVISQENDVATLSGNIDARSHRESPRVS
jgi:hypothetical protein